MKNPGLKIVCLLTVALLLSHGPVAAQNYSEDESEAGEYRSQPEDDEGGANAFVPEATASNESLCRMLFEIRVNGCLSGYDACLEGGFQPDACKDWFNTCMQNAVDEKKACSGPSPIRYLKARDARVIL